MTNKAKWVSQYPRRKNPENIITIYDQLHAAVDAARKAEHEQVVASANMGMVGVLKQFDLVQEAISQLQEAADMYSDLYKLDRGMAKASYIKANADKFSNPEVFLEEETPQN